MTRRTHSVKTFVQNVGFYQNILHQIIIQGFKITVGVYLKWVYIHYLSISKQLPLSPSVFKHALIDLHVEIYLSN